MKRDIQNSDNFRRRHQLQTRTARRGKMKRGANDGKGINQIPRAATSERARKCPAENIKRAGS